MTDENKITRHVEVAQGKSSVTEQNVGDTDANQGGEDVTYPLTFDTKTVTYTTGKGDSLRHVEETVTKEVNWSPDEVTKRSDNTLSCKGAWFDYGPQDDATYSKLAKAMPLGTNGGLDWLNVRDTSATISPNPITQACDIARATRPISK